MSDDVELELFRHGLNCAALLEQIGGGWKLDQRESTRRALKYPGGPGQIIIVNHDGRGWWDPTGSTKGDVFNLVQHLQQGLSFWGVRKVLRRIVGIAPSQPVSDRDRPESGAAPAERWAARPQLAPGCKA